MVKASRRGKRTWAHMQEIGTTVACEDTTTSERAACVCIPLVAASTEREFSLVVSERLRRAVCSAGLECETIRILAVHNRHNLRAIPFTPPGIPGLMNGTLCIRCHDMITQTAIGLALWEQTRVEPSTLSHRYAVQGVHEASAFSLNVIRNVGLEATFRMSSPGMYSVHHDAASDTTRLLGAE